MQAAIVWIYPPTSYVCLAYNVEGELNVQHCFHPRCSSVLFLIGHTQPRQSSADRYTPILHLISNNTRLHVDGFIFALFY